MKLSERVFDIPELQKKIVCNLNMTEYYDPNWRGTLEDSLTYAKSVGKVEYWNAYWVAMQFFDSIENRKLAIAVLKKAIDVSGFEIKKEHSLLSSAMTMVYSYIFGSISEEELIAAHLPLLSLCRTNGKSLVDNAKNFTGSAIAILSGEHSMACPLVLRRFWPIVGEEYLESTVREAIRNHP